MNPRHVYLNAFNLLPQIGPRRFRRLLNFFGDPETAWQANANELIEAGLEESVAMELLEHRRQTDPEREYAKLAPHQIHTIVFDEEAYPPLLREIPDPPVILYIRGELRPRDQNGIAIVGSRKFTPYGKQVSYDLARDLTRAGLTINSGLALGIDAIAHQTVLEHSGRTIAVLASGVDSIYPANNRMLAEKIIAGQGAVISELPLGTPPLKHHFPTRNRIIAGLSLGTIVVEAAVESGALITAAHALEQNRQVFAVPGSIYSPASAGPNNLIKMGAKAVTTANDVLEELNLNDLVAETLQAEVLGDNDEEQKILQSLSRQPRHFDEIAKLTGLPSPTIAAQLTIMEMKGKVRNLGANQYVKSR